MNYRNKVGILLAVLFVLATVPSGFAAAAELPSDSKNEFEYLEEVGEGARGNIAPSANSTAAMPYAAKADIAREVYTNKCVCPNSSSLKLEFEGYVNGDTSGRSAVQIWLYNARTGKHVATRSLGQSRSFALNTTITQLNAGDPYYARIMLTEKTSDATRVSFTLWLKNK